ncbi:hypothetical protein [Nostoc sp. CENA543]|nr:hypothetical protein [Nostoc sp. CENA543]
MFVECVSIVYRSDRLVSAFCLLAAAVKFIIAIADGVSFVLSLFG